MERLEEFKSDILDGMSSEAVFQKHLLASRSAVLTPQQERDLVLAIADSFNVPVTNIFLVGSAQLGFRLIGKKANVFKDIPERPQFSSFDDYSDIDVALISQSNFLTYWRRVHDFFRDAGFVHRERWKDDDPMHGFTYYLMQGWIRPDALPGTGHYNIKQEWTEKVDQITNMKIADYRVTVGLYFDAKFLTTYQANSISKVAKILRSNT
ncbi:hypothetical protein EGT07_21955 [Herbaspirillum sp. HC18]|nr:hypothetical protein EGT07_21955 [Herbaspirillum sp. HC18]